MAPIIRGNSLYTTVSGPSWTQAEAQSIKLGGHLASISSFQENSYLIDTFNTLIQGDVTTYYKWIGFTDQEVEGVWKWTSGEAVAFTNWSGPNPDNNTDWTSPTGQDYAALQWYGGGHSKGTGMTSQIYHSTSQRKGLQKSPSPSP